MRFAVRFTYGPADVRGRWSSVTPSAKEPGIWQLTFFDVDSPEGDAERSTPEAAIEAAIRDGGRPVEVIGPDAAQGERIVAGVVAERERIDAEIEAWLLGDEAAA